jgi:hypothetical protein
MRCGKGERGGDQTCMAEGLGCVAEVAAGGRVVLLTEEPNVVAEGQEAFEQVDRLSSSPDPME